MGDCTASVPLHNGEFAIVDTEDVCRVSGFAWQCRIEPYGQKYALANFLRSDGTRTMVRMHRLLLCFPLMSVDHRDRNGLNNRRQNLRLCDDHANQGNSGKHRPGKYSRFKGVTKHLPTGHWKAQLMKHRKNAHCSYHRCEIEAALAYDAAAVEHFGEFAATNAALGLLEVA